MANDRKNEERLPYIFYIYYAALFMGNAIYNSFFSAYFSQAGMSESHIGLLFGIAPMVGLVMQPIWGGMADRAKTKNRILLLVLSGVMLSIVVFYLVGNFFHGDLTSKLLLLSGAMILFSAFQNAVIPLQDTITLDYISRHGGFYGNARMSGTLGYAAMALVAGAIFNRLPDSVFPLYFVILCFVFYAATRLPKASGYRQKGEKGSVFDVLRDKEILLVLLLTCVQYTTMAYGHTFLGPYMLALGGNSALIGLANTVQALTEIPFHIKWGRNLMRKIGIHRMLVISTILGAMRWTLTALSRSPVLLVIANGFEGLMLVPLIVGVVEYINSRVEKKLKATAQTALTLFSVVIARTVGNIGGGALIDVFDTMGLNGMRMTYWVLVPISLIAVLAIGIPLLAMGRKNKTEEI